MLIYLFARKNDRRRHCNQSLLHVLIIMTIIIIIEAGNRKKRREAIVSSNSEEHLSPMGQPVVDHGGFTSFDISYRICLWLILHTHTHIATTCPFFLRHYIFLDADTFVAAFATSSFPMRFKFTHDTNFRDVL